jgi:hypothetical protein
MEPVVKRTVGALLMLLGGAAIVVGILIALQAFSSMYSSNLSGPLDVPESSEAQVSTTMLRGVYVGAPGVVVFIIGRIIFSLARRRARHASRA